MGKFKASVSPFSPRHAQQTCATNLTRSLPALWLFTLQGPSLLKKSSIFAISYEIRDGELAMHHHQCHPGT